jgi:ankyrin repeat protein
MCTHQHCVFDEVASSFQEGKGPLHWAAQFGEAEALQRLLQTAVDASPQDAAGNTPLHLASFNSHQ